MQKSSNHFYRYNNNSAFDADYLKKTGHIIIAYTEWLLFEVSPSLLWALETSPSQVNSSCGLCYFGSIGYKKPLDLLFSQALYA